MSSQTVLSLSLACFMIHAPLPLTPPLRHRVFHPEPADQGFTKHLLLCLTPTPLPWVLALPPLPRYSPTPCSLTQRPPSLAQPHLSQSQTPSGTAPTSPTPAQALWVHPWPVGGTHTHTHTRLGLEGRPNGRLVYSLTQFPKVKDGCAMVPGLCLSPQATDNPAASDLFAQRLKMLRDKDGFGAVLFSSHVRKVRV